MFECRTPINNRQTHGLAHKMIELQGDTLNAAIGVIQWGMSN